MQFEHTYWEFTEMKSHFSLCTIKILVTLEVTTQPAFTYSKLTIEALEQGVKYVQSWQ